MNLLGCFWIAECEKLLDIEILKKSHTRLTVNFASSNPTTFPTTNDSAREEWRRMIPGIHHNSLLQKCCQITIVGQRVHCAQRHLYHIT